MASEAAAPRTGTGAQDGPLRALHVLESLAALEQPASLPDIAAATDLSKFKAYRVLRALQEDGFVDHRGRRGYRLGSRSVALASLIGPRPPMLRAARPVINGLASATKTRASLSLRSGSHRVLVLGAVPRGSAPPEATWIGQRSPLTSGCVGTVILAQLPEEEAAQIIGARPEHEHPPSPHDLAVVRRRGFAMSFSDNHAALNGVAAALLDPEDGYPFGSIGLAGPAERFPESVLRELCSPLLRACASLGPQLARVLGRHSSQRLDALDVTIRGFLEG